MDHSSMDNVISFHPDFEKIKSEVARFRTELSMLVLERDELLYHECPNIESAYMLTLGALEIKLYQLDVEVRKLKRKLEIMQARLNRQEKIIIDEIEDILEKEFLEYKAKLNEQIAKMNEALERRRFEELSETDSIELKKIYRMLVKELHPDLNPDISEEQKNLFHNVVAAYENGDIDALKIISETVLENDSTKDVETDSYTRLIKEKDRLQALLKKVKNETDNIKSNYPYLLKPLLENSVEVHKRKSELNKEFDILKNLYDEYLNRIARLL